MKKKRVLTLVLACMLVAALSVGATLAYLSSTSSTVTNSFTVGTGYVDPDPDPDHPDTEQAILVDETDITNPNGPRVLENEYQDLLPGDERIKDPQVYLTGGSVESYVFVKVTGIEAAENENIYVDGWNDAQWIKVYNLDGTEAAEDDTTGDGIYRYYSVVNYSDYTEEDEEYGKYIMVGAPIFTGIGYSGEVEELPEQFESKFQIQACAVQNAQSFTEWTDAIATTGWVD